MAKYIVALCLLASAAMAEHWVIQLPITTLGANSTVNIDASYGNKGVIKGWYIDVSGNDSASFTSTVSAVSGTKGVRTLANGIVATVSAPAVTNDTAYNLFDEVVRLTIISPATATNSVTVNGVILYEK